MVYTKLISGLGNQLFQYAIGRQLSLMHNVNLKLDTSFFDTQNLRSFKLQHFNIKADVATPDEIYNFLNPYRNPSAYYKIYRKFVNRFPKYNRKYFTEAEWWVYEPELFKTSPNVYIEGYWQHYKYFQNIRPEIFQELTLREPYSANVGKTVEEMKENPASISLHIRRGDYITDTDANKLMGVMPLSYYYRSIEYLKQQLSDPVIYIFSDDLGWAKDNLKTDVPLKLMDVENGKKDYLELDIMSKCNHHIIANSSFSWWGAFLGQNINKIVIAPRKWVVPDDVNSRIHIQLSNWIKL